MSSVTLHQLGKRFSRPGQSDVVAVENLDLEIPSGEFRVLVGPSGGGKSTVLRLIAGLETPTSGEIRIDGRNVRDLAPADRGLAFVFQHHALYPHLNVRDNLALGLVLRGASGPSLESRVREMAHLLDLDSGLLTRKPAALSGGQRQRVALGRALMLQPKVLLLDEPLSSLDPALRARTRLELSQLQQRLGTTMILVTHDHVEAMTLGQRLAVMGGGRLQQTGAPMDIYARPANLFVARFLGSPPMNVWEGRFRTDLHGKCFESTSGTRLPLGLGEIPNSHESQPLLLGVRPENIHLATDPELGFRAILRQIEPGGAESFLHFDDHGTPCVVRQTGLENFRIGEEYALNIEPGKAHFFHPPNGPGLQATPDTFNIETWSIAAKRA
jgi:multiple sugar transport system ATP-binding protein